MIFDWDENKRQQNIDKHEVDFVDAIRIFEDPRVVIYRSKRSAEARDIAIGFVNGRTMVVIFTKRGNVSRIISARPASRKERQLYDQA